MKKIEDFKVIGQRWLNYKNFILEVEAPSPLPNIQPGNFAEIGFDNSPRVFLRRPFSIFDANYEKNTLSFYVKIVGEGSRLLGILRKGDNLNLIFPLGNNFSVPAGDKVLVMGGGTGIAPFILLAKKLKEHGKKMTFLVGGRTSEDIFLTEVFRSYGTVHVTTEDGTTGEKGLATQHSIFNSSGLPYDFIYACGPDAMMKAIGKISKSKGIPCEASLENSMACGFGACLCCVVETNEGNKCVCTEGPIFNIKDLKW
jgi:dihydroorotate dehydrogenase electron transfer subunit